MSIDTNMPEVRNDPAPSVPFMTRVWRMPQLWWRVVFVAIAMIGVGGLMIWDTQDTDHVEHHSLVGLEAGKRPDGKLVQVSGSPLDIVVVETEGITQRPTLYYVPIVSVNWGWGDEVACVAKMNPKDYDAMIEADEDIVAIKGMAHKHLRLDSEVRKLFEGIEPSIDLASSYIVLDERSDPVIMRRSGFGAVGFGCVLLLICAGTVFLQSGEGEVDEFAGDRALRAAMTEGNSKMTARAAKRDMSDCDDAVRQWCQTRGFSGYQER